ncbi:hypothetical protein ACLI4Z_04545 [Natrialbaceae archaeon A-arb3/5]
MGRRDRSTALSRLGRLRKQVRANLTGVGRSLERSSTSERSSTDESNESTPLGNLFHCPACCVVYIAADKEACSACDDDVEQVRSTFTHQ